MTSNTVKQPQLIYHYTNAAGLLGMLDTARLWATDASFLNDAQEMRFGRDELVAALDREGRRRIDSEAPSRGGPEYSRGTVMRSAAETIRNDTPVDGQPAVSVYVVCFCEDGDLLGQWRGYAEGSGYAIGFDRAYLEQLRFRDGRPGAGPDPVPGPSLVKVAYGKSAVDELVRRVIDGIQPQPTGHPNATGWSRAQDFVWPSLAGIKHAAFREEREWRLVHFRARADEPLLFRTGLLGVLPYRAVEFDVSAAISEIVVGPGPHQALRVRGVQQLVSRAGNSF